MKTCSSDGHPLNPATWMSASMILALIAIGVPAQATAVLSVATVAETGAAVNLGDTAQFADYRIYTGTQQNYNQSVQGELASFSTLTGANWSWPDYSQYATAPFHSLTVGATPYTGWIEGSWSTGNPISLTHTLKAANETLTFWFGASDCDVIATVSMDGASDATSTFTTVRNGNAKFGVGTITITGGTVGSTMNLSLARTNGGTYSSPNITAIALSADQSEPPLTANAGADQAVSPASPTAVIGGNPSASGGTGPYVYTWSPATGLSDATVANPTANPTTTTEYTLTVTDSASPTPAEASDTVTVTYSEPPLVANAGADKDLSPSMPSAQIGGSPAALDGTPPYTYSWSPATGLSDPTVANPTASPTTTTEYTLTVTDSASPTPAQVSDTVTVTYTVPPLVANAGADKTVGEGSPPASIGGSPAASGGTPPYTYGWTSDPAGFTSAEPNPAVLPTVTTVYTLTVTDSASATASDTVTITFTVTPSTVFASEDFESYPVATNASSVSLGWYNWVFGTDDGEGNIVGKLNGGLGWAEGWSNGGLASQNGTPGVTSTSPNFIISEGGPSGKFYDGANASSDNSGYGKSRRFASTIGDSWQSSALSFGASGATVGFSSTSGYWSFNITSNGGNYGLAEYGGGAQTVNLVKAVSTDPASPDRVVTKIAGSLVSLWINPVNTSSEAALGTPDVTITVGHPNLTAYTMSGKVRVDNILVGSTLAAVMPSSGSPYEAWAALHAGSQSASEDFDLDGVPNGVEFFMGSPAGMTSAPGVLDGKVTWPRVGVVASFDVQVSNDLVTWTTADPADVDTSDPSEVVYTLPPGADKSFCRLMVIP